MLPRRRHTGHRNSLCPRSSRSEPSMNSSAACCLTIANLHHRYKLMVSPLRRITTIIRYHHHALSLPLHMHPKECHHVHHHIPLINYTNAGECSWCSRTTSVWFRSRQSGQLNYACLTGVSCAGLSDELWQARQLTCGWRGRSCAACGHSTAGWGPPAHPGSLCRPPMLLTHQPPGCRGCPARLGGAAVQSWPQRSSAAESATASRHNINS